MWRDQQFKHKGDRLIWCSQKVPTMRPAMVQQQAHVTLVPTSRLLMPEISIHDLPRRADPSGDVLACPTSPRLAVARGVPQSTACSLCPAHTCLSPVSQAGAIKATIQQPASRRSLLSVCSCLLEAQAGGGAVSAACANVCCEGPMTVPLSSTLDFLRLPSTGKCEEILPFLMLSGGQDGLNCVQWPPALREGRMELQGYGLNTHGMDSIIEHLARQPAIQDHSSDTSCCSDSQYSSSPHRSPPSAGEREIAVRSLHLSDNDLRPIASVVLARELRYNSSLKLLDLSSNSIGDQGASALSAVLIANTTLESLDVASNGISKRGLDCLAMGLRHNKSLKSLELSFNGFGDGACQTLCEALDQNSSLQYLGLGFNGIMCPGALSLTRGLINSHSLQRLELSYNALGDTGTAQIAKALCYTRVLETLGLVSNGISDLGATALAEALAENTSLMVLGLSSNNISCAGAQALSKALRANDTLQGLYLEENDIGEQGSADLKSIIETTASCKPLDPDLQLALIMGLDRRLGTACPLFALDSFLCREIVGMCQLRRPRDILYYPKVVEVTSEDGV